MPKKIPDRNKSPYGWWVATVIERYVYDDEDDNPKRRSTAWRNLIMLKARDRNQAYRKAIAYAEIGKGDEGYRTDKKTGRRLKIVYQGIADLTPVFDEIDEDGFEVCFSEYRNISVKRIESWILQKHQLKVFNDSEESPEQKD